MKAITESEYRENLRKALTPLIISALLFIITGIFCYFSSHYEKTTLGATCIIIAMISLFTMIPFMIWGSSLSSYANNNVVVSEEKIYIPGRIIQKKNKNQTFTGGSGAVSRKGALITPTIIIDIENISHCNFDPTPLEQKDMKLNPRTFYANTQNKATHVVFKVPLKDVHLENLHDVFLHLENHEKFSKLLKK